MNKISLSIYELESSAVKKLVRKIVSEKQVPCICMCREPLNDKIVYNTYIKSPYSSDFYLLKRHTDLTAFCLWYISDKQLSNFDFYNFTHVTYPYE